MKELILQIKKIQQGGFFQRGFMIVSIIRRDGDKEHSLGDYSVQSAHDEGYRKVQAIGRKYRNEGYTLLGEWDL